MKTEFIEHKKALIEYIAAYIERYLSKQATIPFHQSSYGHNLNRDFQRFFADSGNFDHLHNAIPLIIKYWYGDYQELIQWLNKGGNYPPGYTGANKDLWWNLYYILKALKPKS